MGDRRGRLMLASFLFLALLFLLLSVAGLWDALAAPWKSLEGAWTLRLPWLLAALALGTGNLIGMAALWTLLARRWGGPIDFAEGITAWVGANLGRYIPGKIWQLAGLAAYVRGRGGSSAVALVSAVVFQLVILISGIAAALLTLRERLGTAFGGSPVVPILIAGGLALLLHPALIRRAAPILAGLLREDRTTVADLMRRDRSGHRVYTWLLGAAVLPVWWAYGLGLWCIAAGIFESPPGDPWTLSGVFAASYVAGYVSLVTPGGLVVREGAMALLLVSVTPISGAAAAVLAIVARLWTVLAELAAFGLAALARGIRSRTSSRAASRGQPPQG